MYFSQERVVEYQIRPVGVHQVKKKKKKKKKRKEKKEEEKIIIIT